MITAIDKNHAIFNSEEYLKDIVPFSLMEKIKQRGKVDFRDVHFDTEKAFSKYKK